MHKILGAALAAMLTAGAANATILIDTTNAYLSNQYAVGTGSSVRNFTSYVNAQGASAGALSNADLVNSATALILNLRVNGTGATSQLSGTEITNLQAFIATGKRVLIIGENNNFAGWNQSFISAVGYGAQYSTTATSGSTTAIASNDLTAGVTTATISGGGTILGGNQLFSQNVAATFGPSDNVLLVMDLTPTLSSTSTTNQNDTFQRNMAAWLGASSTVPEPSTWGMMLVGFGAVGYAMRRQRKADVSFC